MCIRDSSQVIRERDAEKVRVEECLTRLESDMEAHSAPSPSLRATTHNALGILTIMHAKKWTRYTRI
eukprot:3026912-Pyramimonas_sp.AAC.1